MVTKIVTKVYSEFKALIDAFPKKGQVVYYDNSPTTFGAIFVASDFSYSLYLVSLTSIPGSFLTDFPNAIQSANIVQYGTVEDIQL